MLFNYGSYFVFTFLYVMLVNYILQPESFHILTLAIVKEMIYIKREKEKKERCNITKFNTFFPKPIEKQQLDDVP